MAYVPPLNGGRINATISGNTSGAGALMSTGTISIAGGNNITLSQNGNAVTISGPTTTVGSNSIGMSNLGNTSGTTGVVSGSGLRYALAGGNNVTLSQSLNGSSGTVTISAANQSIQTQSRFNMTLSGNTAGVMAQVSSGTLTLAGGNNITLSQNGNAVTISGGGMALYDGANSISSGTAVFSDGNNVSFGINGQTITASVAPPFNAGVSNLGQTAGNTGSNTDGLVLAGNGNITLSQATDVNGATVTIDDGGPNVLSYFNPQDAYLQVTGQQGQGTLHIQPSPAPNVSFDRVVFPIVFTGATSVTASITMSMWMGIYTRTSATLSLSTSFSTSNSLIHSGTQNSSQNVGLKLFTMGASHSLSEGAYYMGILSRTTSGGGNATISQILASQQNSNLGGFWGQSPSASIQYTRGLGTYSATTSAIPASVAFSQLTGTGSNVLRQPMFYLVNSTF